MLNNKENKIKVTRRNIKKIYLSHMLIQWKNYKKYKYVYIKYKILISVFVFGLCSNNNNN